MGYAATRVVMADCSHGVFWIACYCTGDAKKDKEYLCRTLIQKLRDCEKRGWKCRGMVTDNAATELAAMELLKVEFEKEFKRAFVILRCILHTVSLAQGDVLPWPKVSKGEDQVGKRAPFRRGQMETFPGVVGGFGPGG